MRTVKLVILFFTLIYNTYGQENISVLDHVSCAAPFDNDAIIKDDYLIIEQDFTIKLKIFTGVSIPAPQTNTIYITSDEYDKYFQGGVPFQYFNSIAKMLFQKFDNYKNYEFIITQTYNNEETITFVRFHKNTLYGITHNIKAECGGHNIKATLSKFLTEAKENNKTTIWYGDNLKNLDISRISDNVNNTIYRRSIYIDTPITISGLSSKFEPANSTFCNAVPRTTSQLNDAGFSSLSIDKWKLFYNRVNKIGNSSFSSTIYSTEDLKKELIHGNKDMLLIIAHSDGIYLYIGNERISINDIYNWENRYLTSERTAILLVCDAANPNLKKGWWLWRQSVEPLSDILIKKGYFSRVIAPDHEIRDSEVLPVLSMILENKTLIEIRNKFSGWMEYVFNFSRNSFFLNYDRHEK